MKTFNFFTLLLCLYMTPSCSSFGEKKQKNLAPPTATGNEDEDFKQALDLSKFPEKAFLDVQVDKRCDGIKDFFNTYAKIYLNNVSVIDERKCLERFDKDSYEYNYGFSFKKENSILKIDSYITKFGTQVTIEEKTLHTYDQIYNFDPTWKDESNLIRLDITFKSWIDTPQSKNIIFNVPYEQFVTSVLSRFSEKSENSSVGEGDDLISFHLFPEFEQKVEGRVKFVAVGDDLFIKYQDRNIPQYMGGFLGCNSMECLNNNSIRFKIFADTLFFYRIIPKEETDGLNTTVIYSLKFNKIQ